MRLGISSFLNAKPFYSLQRRYPSLIATPRALKEALLKEEVDAALVSAAAFLDGGFTPYSFGIGATKRSMSVLLFLRRPDDLILSIAVSSASETSVSLLKILLTHHWKKPFTLFSSINPAQEKASGYLLIGDEALFHKTALPSFDLATLWHEFCALPFIFALFAARQKNEELTKNLAEAIDNFFLKIDRETEKDYFTCLNYRFEPPHLKGLCLFHELRQKLPSNH